MRRGPCARRGFAVAMQRERRSLPGSAKSRQKLPLSYTLASVLFAPGMVDKNGSRPLYRTSWARRRLARWRVCEAPHCSHGDRACGHALVAMFASLRRMCGLLLPLAIIAGATRRRGCKVPGCLTGESEERETWTAESLRAASGRGKPCAEKARKRLRRSTF